VNAPRRVIASISHHGADLNSRRVIAPVSRRAVIPNPRRIRRPQFPRRPESARTPRGGTSSRGTKEVAIIRRLFTRFTRDAATHTIPLVQRY
jgi:hypothetical protein